MMVRGWAASGDSAVPAWRAPGTPAPPSATGTCDRQNQHREPGTGGAAHAVMAAVTRHLAALLRPPAARLTRRILVALGKGSCVPTTGPQSGYRERRKRAKRKASPLHSAENGSRSIYTARKTPTRAGSSRRVQERAQRGERGHRTEHAAAKQLLFKLKATHTHKCFASHPMALSTQAGTLTT